MTARSLKGRHVQALLERWQAEGLSAGTLKNRFAHLRWWAEKVGKAGITSPEQRAALNEAHRVAGAGSLIPPHKTYIQHRHTYDGRSGGTLPADSLAVFAVV